MAIMVVEKGRKALRIERQAIERETYLQEYVQSNPETLPVEELKPGAKLLVVAREFPTASGPIDALAIDDDGDIYIVETKLAKNPDKRRVIAQMLDYGAALWSGGAESFLERAGGNDDLAAKIGEAFSLEEGSEIEAVVSALEANVEAGRFHFVVLMNEMDERLKTLITFVNSNSRFTILGLEFDVYTHGELDILIPRLFGAEARKVSGSEGPRARRRTWSEAEFFDEASHRLSTEQLRRVRELYDWAREAGEVSFGSGEKFGGFNITFPSLGVSRLFKVTLNGALVIRISQLGDLGFALRDALATAGFELAPDRKKPEIPIDEWGPALPRLIAAIETLVSRESGAS
jgi:hypothetical protein